MLTVAVSYEIELQKIIVLNPKDGYLNRQIKCLREFTGMLDKCYVPAYNIFYKRMCI